MQSNTYLKKLLLFCLTFSIAHSSMAQSDAEVKALIFKQDSLFWITYNTCDTAANKSFFTTDVEFYHDKGGVTLGSQALATSLKNNLCSNPDFRLRRQAVPGTVHVFPLRNGSNVYGAVISGEHLFYIIEKGNERVDGLAKFTHLWIVKDGVWKMSRILSYDHGPVPDKYK
jgi:hypothetical protein